MKRKKRSKAHLGFVAVVISLFVFYAWYQDDLITEIAEKPKSLVGDISGMMKLFWRVYPGN